MKAKLLIITFLILCFLGTFMSAHSQAAIYGAEGNVAKIVPSKDSSLIADETWLTYSKTGAKIISYSEQAFKDISLKFGEQFKSITIKYKADRNGPYKEYAIYLSQDVANSIKEWAKTNL